MRSSPLESAHEAAGASFTDFAGYRMPVRYSSDLADPQLLREGRDAMDRLTQILQLGSVYPFQQ